MDWTDDRIETLRELLAKGLSAMATGASMGISRNTVIGKARRMGFRVGMGRQPRAPGPRSAAARNTPRPKSIALASPKPLPRPLLRSPPVQLPPMMPDAIPILPRHWETRGIGECAAPIGQGESLLSCCNPCGEHRYCPDHAAQFTIPTERRIRVQRDWLMT